MGRNRDAVHIGARAAEQSSSEQGVPECVRVSVLCKHGAEQEHVLKKIMHALVAHMRPEHLVQRPEDLQAIYDSDALVEASGLRANTFPDRE